MITGKVIVEEIGRTNHDGTGVIMEMSKMIILKEQAGEIMAIREVLMVQIMAVEIIISQDKIQKIKAVNTPVMKTMKQMQVQEVEKIIVVATVKDRMITTERIRGTNQETCTAAIQAIMEMPTR